MKLVTLFCTKTNLETCDVRFRIKLFFVFFSPLFFILLPLFNSVIPFFLHKFQCSSTGGKCAESPPTFIRGKRRKNWKRRGLRTLSVKGSGVVFTHREGISTLRVYHKGRHPLIECTKMTSNCFIFPFLCPFVFLCFLCFLSFCGRQECFPCFYVFLNCDEEIKPT